MNTLIARLVCLCLLAICKMDLVSAQQEPDRYALLIGVTTYDQPQLNGLKYPEKDVEDLSRVLSDNGYRVDKLQGTRATQAEIRTKLRSLANKGQRGGVIFVALSGHGIEIQDPASRVNKSYFCPVDAALGTVEDADGKKLYQTDGVPLLAPRIDSLIAIDEILMALGESKAMHRIIVTDCCRDDPTTAKSLRARSFGTSLNTKDLPVNCVMLMACSSGERSFEHDDWGHGALAKCLIDELVSGTSQTMVEVANNVPPKVSQLVKQKKGSESQIPRFLITGRVELLFANSKARAANGSALNGDTDFRTGLKYYHGEKDSTIDEIRALRFFRRAADDGHPIAAAWVANSYSLGWGGSYIDQVEAIRWMRRAMPRLASLAETGNDNAALIFGWALTEGIGVQRDANRARGLFERCEKNGSVEAIVHLGGIYESEGDKVKAFANYLEADRKGSIWGTYSFSRALAGGLDILNDPKQAFELMEKARAANFPWAFHQSGHYYNGSIENSPREENAEQAFRLFQQSYDLGNRNMPCLANCYFYGYGVPADPRKGLELLTTAAQTDPLAQEELIRRIEEGDGVTKDLRKLTDWRRTHLKTYQEAARLGDASSLSSLLKLTFDPKYAQLTQSDFSVSGILTDMMKRSEIPNRIELIHAAGRAVISVPDSATVDQDMLAELAGFIQQSYKDLEGRDQGYMLDLMAHLLERKGDYEKAITMQEKAVALCQDASLTDYLSELRKRYLSGSDSP